MVDLAFSLGGLLLAFVLVALNGFFVASEFAFVRIRADNVDRLVRERRVGSAQLKDAMDNLDDYLAVTQLGITISSLGLGWIGEPAVASLIEPVVDPFLTGRSLHLVAFIIGFSIITFLHVVFGELAPKTIAIAKAERISLLVAPPMHFFYYLFIPGIIVFNGTANFFTRLIGVPPVTEADETLSEEEILMALSRSGKEGEIDEDEVKMIEGIFELDDKPVREVMTPRPDVSWVSKDADMEEIIKVVDESGHTRFPVIDVESDDILGFIDVKDIMRYMDPWEPGDIDIEVITRDLPVFPESTPIDDLLEKLREQETQMAAIIDEWGAFEGVVTVEDILEEIVGDIRDNFDIQIETPLIKQQNQDEWLLDGVASIDEVNEELGTDFQSKGFNTIAGLILENLARSPKKGDTVKLQGYQLEIIEKDGERIQLVRIKRKPDK